MIPGKRKWSGCGRLIHKVHVAAFFKTCPVNMLIIGIVFYVFPSFAQETKDSTVSPNSATEEIYKLMIDYSRPGKNHELYEEIVGTWRAKGKHFQWEDSVTRTVDMEFSVTLVRKSFANGRYFISDIISDGTLQMPIQDGKMKEVKYQGLEIEGYDNVKKKFVRSSIGNHLLSGIPVAEGVYDPATKTITFEDEIEMAPGLKAKDKLLFIFIDKDHYKMEAYREEKGKFILDTEINLTRVPGK